MEWTQAHIDHAIRTSLTAMIAKSFNHLKNGEELRIGWLIRCMAWHLEDVLAGRSKRLIINVPPRHLKSVSASVAFPAFALGKDPATTITLVCYSGELADKMMRDLRDVMESDWYRRVFPRTRLKVQRAAEITTTARGGVNATSVGASITGRGSDIIVIDDPIKPSSAFSDAERNHTNDWLRNTLFSRLNNKKTGRIILAMQRLHEDDATGYLTQDPEHRWTVLKVPAIAPENARCRIGNVPGQEWFEREEGSLIDPDREDYDALERIRADLGSLYFSAQYQQEPLPREGNMVQRAWFRWYDPLTLHPSDCEHIVVSWDTASEAGPGNDYSVGTVWGLKGQDFYLMAVYRRRLNYPDLRKMILQVFEDHNADLLLLERADSGRHLLRDLGLRRDQILSIAPKGSKEDRMAAGSHLIECGSVHLPQNAPWLQIYLREVLGFPGTKFDDQVDSTSQFLNWVRQGKRRLGPPRSRDRELSPCRATRHGQRPTLGPRRRLRGPRP